MCQFDLIHQTGIEHPLYRKHYIERVKLCGRIKINVSLNGYSMAFCVLGTELGDEDMRSKCIHFLSLGSFQSRGEKRK